MRPANLWSFVDRIGWAVPSASASAAALIALIAGVGWTRAADDPPPEKKPAAQAGLDPAAQQRLENALDVLRDYHAFEDVNLWTGALRDLVQLGKPAVPLLIVELETTNDNMTKRAMAFALRAIGDPRAIPALIRTIPRTLVKPSSDYGVRLEGDLDLLDFMQRHDGEMGNRGTNFHYGRPFREVVAALRKLTGVKHWEMEVNFVNLGGSAQQRRTQRELYRKVTKTWADWWSKNWQRYLPDAADAEVDLTLAAAEPRIAQKPSRPAAFPVGPDVETGAGSARRMLPLFSKSPGRGFLDLDTGRYARPPAELVAETDQQPSPELLAWAAREGVDLIGIERTSPAGKTYRGLLPVGLRVRRIEESTRKAIIEDLQQGKPLDVPRDFAGPIPPNADGTTTYAYITREGGCGFLKLNPAADKPIVPGTPSTLDDRGLQYEFVFIKPAPDDGEAK